MNGVNARVEFCRKYMFKRKRIRKDFDFYVEFKR